MPSVNIDWVAVIAAALVNMVLGSIWYSKQLFGNQWARLTGRKLSAMMGGTGYAIAAAGALLQSWILDHFVIYAQSSTFAEGAVTGFWLWVAFVAVVAAVNTTFEGRSWQLWKINVGYFLIVLVVNGGLLAIWS